MEKELRDALAAMTAGMDQLGAFGGDFCTVVSTYFQALLTNGLERGEALALTINYQAQLLSYLLTPDQT